MTVQELKTGQKLIFYEEFLTFLQKEMEVNPMFPKSFCLLIDWLIDWLTIR